MRAILTGYVPPLVVLTEISDACRDLGDRSIRNLFKSDNRIHDFRKLETWLDNQNDPRPIEALTVMKMKQ